MPNPNVQQNVTMVIRTPIDPDQNRYVKIPYWPQAWDAFIPPYLGLFEWKCLKFDRKGPIYQLGMYFTIVNAIQSPHWFKAHDGFSAAAMMFSYVAQIVSFIAVSLIINGWMKRDITKMDFMEF